MKNKGLRSFLRAVLSLFLGLLTSALFPIFVSLAKNAESNTSAAESMISGSAKTVKQKKQQ